MENIHKIGRPPDWPDAKTLFANRLQEILPFEGSGKLSKNYFLNASPKTVLKYLSGEVEPPVSRVLRVAEATGCDLQWLMTGLGDRSPKMNEDSGFAQPTAPDSAGVPMAKSLAKEGKEKMTKNKITPIEEIPPGNAIRRKGDQDAAHNILRLKTVGTAAALMKGTNSRGSFDDPELYWDSIREIPESTHLVKIRGDSMAPLMMHGQEVMVGTMYGANEVPRSREIVVVEVTVRDNDIGGMDGQWEGIHCKRVQDGESTWIFTSINPTGETFSVAKDNCRLWHVIGVYYGEKSKIPEED